LDKFWLNFDLGPTKNKFFQNGIGKNEFLSKINPVFEKKKSNFNQKS
jgi:hypothetical protein